MEPIEQTFLMPFPPSVNGLYRNAAFGGRVKTEAYKAWQKEAGWTIKTQFPKPMTGKVCLTIRAVKPDKRKRDIMNLEKAITDLLVDMGIIEDDSLVQSGFMEWVSSDLAGVSVTIVKYIEPVVSEAANALPQG